MKLPYCSNNDDVEECQYGWQENKLAAFWQWLLLRQLLLLAAMAWW